MFCVLGAMVMMSYVDVAMISVVGHFIMCCDVYTDQSIGSK